jgi:hypothetical protein
MLCCGLYREVDALNGSGPILANSVSPTLLE